VTHKSSNFKKKPREVSENVQVDPSGTSGGGMNPVPVLQQQLDAPRAQESRTTCDADGSRGRKGRLHGARDEPKQALHAARRMAGAIKSCWWWKTSGVYLVDLQSLGPRSIIFGATRSWWIGTPALATGWTIAEDGTLLRVAPSSCNSPQAQCTRPPKSGGLGVSNSTGRFPRIK